MCLCSDNLDPILYCDCTDHSLNGGATPVLQPEGAGTDLSLEHGWSGGAAPVLQPEGEGADHAVLQVTHRQEGVHQVGLASHNIVLN